MALNGSTAPWGPDLGADLEFPANWLNNRQPLIPTATTRSETMSASVLSGRFQQQQDCSLQRRVIFSFAISHRHDHQLRLATTSSNPAGNYGIIWLGQYYVLLHDDNRQSKLEERMHSAGWLAGFCCNLKIRVLPMISPADSFAGSSPDLTRRLVSRCTTWQKGVACIPAKPRGGWRRRRDRS